MKPLIRGYIHQIAFFIALGACALLLAKSNHADAFIANIIYSITLCGMYGISALYHRPIWSRGHYLLIRSFDHGAIFTLIAGTATPICFLGLKSQSGLHFLIFLWGIAIIGVTSAIFWTRGPKWSRACLYLLMGWLAIVYFSEIKAAIGTANMQLLLLGGILYTLGALIYAFKWPNPFPKIFGYHEIFHLLVVIASTFHFIVIYRLTINVFS